MNDTSVFAGLKPEGLWRHFAAITHIPRPSRHEEQMAAYVQAVADRLKYPVKKDARRNLCVQVPGHPSRVSAQVVVLQSHLDMVCERDSTSPHDAERGDIHAVRDGDWIRAEGTTLGADNGIGVATMLAVAEDADLVHGPLDLLFTLDEETGLNGAKELDPQIVRGRVLLNLDNEDHGEFCVGCAGSTDVTVIMRRPRSPVPAGWASIEVKVSGLLGGHSGTDIIKPRLNAIRALGRIMQHVTVASDCRLVSLTGGNKRNAIPREATAVVVLPADRVESARKAVEKAAEELRKQYAGRDDKLTVAIQPAQAAGGAWPTHATQSLVQLLVAMPLGVWAMSPAVTGLVETSISMGTAVTEGDAVQVGFMIRSSLDPALADVLDSVGTVASLAGAEMLVVAGYPGWQPNLASPVLALAKAAHQRLFGAEAKVTAVHAGLECGVIGERIPGMDMVSFGPTIQGAHAPGERVHVGAVERFWRLLGAVLEDLSSRPK